jgi:hypothetical protein
MQGRSNKQYEYSAKVVFYALGILIVCVVITWIIGQ